MLMLFLVLYWAVILLAEYIYRKTINKEFWRKIAHIASCGITYFAFDYLLLWQFVIICIVFAIVFFVNKKYVFLETLKTQRWYGDIYIIVWLLLLFWYTQVSVVAAKIGVLILWLSDWLAVLWPRILPQKIYKKKTIWWVLIFIFFAVGSVLLHFGEMNWLLYFIPIVALTELLSERGIDNITIPIIFILLSEIWFRIFW